MESEVEIMNANTYQEMTKGEKEQELVYPIESENGDELENYKLDAKKRRIVYNYNKKAPFVYSNKVE